MTMQIAATPRRRQRRAQWAWLLSLTLASLLAACSTGSPPATTAPTAPRTTSSGAAQTAVPNPTTAATPLGANATATRTGIATVAPPGNVTPRATQAATATRGVATSAAGTPAPASAGPPQQQTIRVPTKQGQAEPTQERTITLPAGFQISVYAAGLGQARLMIWSPEGALVVSEQGTTNGRVSILTDRDGNGTSDERITFAQGLRNPHGLAFRDGYLYVAAENQVVRYRWQGGAAAQGNPEVVIPSLPTGGHATRTIGYGPDGRLYLAVGSSCNVCTEQDGRRAAIYQYNADGSGGRLYARGLRNAVGFVWQPGTGALWATNNGRDGLGDDTPPETINLVRDGADFGWPYCHSGRIPDPQFGRQGSCDNTAKPSFELQAHSAPLGLAFYPGQNTGQTFPAAYSGDLFVAFHGSWNRSTPTGYKIVRARFQNGQPTGQTEDFATGWLPDDSRSSWGRPVDVSVGPTGSLYVTDDALGVIYRISYAGR
ncbi:MAG TPA: PQQ-dependent sugar dehydrogenase [Thermomicrobiales bacterium]